MPATNSRSERRSVQLAELNLLLAAVRGSPTPGLPPKRSNGAVSNRRRWSQRARRRVARCLDDRPRLRAAGLGVRKPGRLPRPGVRLCAVAPSAATPEPGTGRLIVLPLRCRRDHARIRTIGPAEGSICSQPRRISSSHQTQRWRKLDSNHRSRIEGQGFF